MCDGLSVCKYASEMFGNADYENVLEYQLNEFSLNQPLCN